MKTIEPNSSEDLINQFISAESSLRELKEAKPIHPAHKKEVEDLIWAYTNLIKVYEKCMKYRGLYN